MNSIFLYIPNLLNYIRLLLLVISVKAMIKSPFICFVTAIIAGLLDFFDGRLSRLFHETSTFGAVLDVAMDSMTNLMQLFFLASVYPKQWALLFIISIIEICNENLTMILLNHKNLINIFKHEMHNNKENFVFLMRSSQIHDLLRIKDSTPEFNTKNEYILNEFIYPYVLYSSDLFYWIIYFGYFIRHNNSYNLSIRHDYTKLAKVNDSADNLAIFVQSEVPLSQFNSNKSTTEYLIGASLAIPRLIYNFIHYFNNLLVDVGNFFDLNCPFLTNIVSFKLLSLICGYACLIGAVIKIHLNIIGLITGLNTLAEYDLQFKRNYPI